MTSYHPRTQYNNGYIDNQHNTVGVGSSPISSGPLNQVAFDHGTRLKKRDLRRCAWGNIIRHGRPEKRAIFIVEFSYRLMSLLLILGRGLTVPWSVIILSRVVSELEVLVVGEV